MADPAIPTQVSWYWSCAPCAVTWEGKTRCWSCGRAGSRVARDPVPTPWWEDR